MKDLRFFFNSGYVMINELTKVGGKRHDKISATCEIHKVDVKSKEKKIQ